MELLNLIKISFKEHSRVIVPSTLLVIIFAFIVGGAAHYISDKEDSRLEQIAEKVLDKYGIEYDFSSDIKEKAR